MVFQPHFHLMHVWFECWVNFHFECRLFAIERTLFVAPRNIWLPKLSKLKGMENRLIGGALAYFCMNFVLDIRRSLLDRLIRMRCWRRLWLDDSRVLVISVGSWNIWSRICCRLICRKGEWRWLGKFFLRTYKTLKNTREGPKTLENIKKN